MGLDAAALAEAWIGAGRGPERLLFVSLGTGVGGGLVFGGRIVEHAQRRTFPHVFADATFALAALGAGVIGAARVAMPGLSVPVLAGR